MLKKPIKTNPIRPTRDGMSNPPELDSKRLLAHAPHLSQ